jgi:hypothetical protein
MCHGFIDPRFLMRETEDRLTDNIRVPVADPAPRPSLVPGLVATLRRLVAWSEPKSEPERATVAAE